MSLLIRFIAFGSLLGGSANSYRAIDRFLHPNPFFSLYGEAWYEYFIDALFGFIIAGACIHYEYRHYKRERVLRAYEDPVDVGEERWKDHTELRVAIYAFAVKLILAFPINVFKAMEAANSPTPFPTTFWRAFSPASLFPLCFGILFIAYDRYRMIRDIERQIGICKTCGYDLRATPDRCPECGTAVGSPK